MPAEIFDEARRAWIAAHEGIFLSQKRRSELLGKKLRSQIRNRAGARPDSHDDKVTPAWLFRRPSTPLVWILIGALPVGLPLAWIAYRCILTLIPEKLRAYPIPALLWAGVACALPLPVFYHGCGGLSTVLMVPWMLAQIPAVFLVAAVYGVLEGWLAVDGSTQWWPLTPVAAEIDDDLILGPGDVSMPTVLDPPPQGKPRTAPKRLTPPRIHWFPMLSGATIAAGLALWYCWEILSAVWSPTVG